MCESYGELICQVQEMLSIVFFFSAWIVSLYLANGCFFSPVGCYINDRFSYRFTAILGSFAGVIGFFLASLSSKLWMMYLTFGVLSGVGHTMVYNSCYLMVLLYFAKWRSVAVGIVASAPAIGMFVITRVTQLLLTSFGWQWALRGFALLHFVCCLCSTVFVPLHNDHEETTNNDFTACKISKKEATKENSLWGNYSFLIMLTSLVVVEFSYFVPMVHIVSTGLLFNLWYVFKEPWRCKSYFRSFLTTYRITLSLK